MVRLSVCFCAFICLCVLNCVSLSSPSCSQFQGEASKQMFYQRGFARLSLYLNVLRVCWFIRCI